MPRKAQYRLFQDKQKLIELLGFDTKEAYEQWTKTDRLFLTFWNDFREKWLLPQREKAREGNKKKRSKDATLEEVSRQIVCGEANGRRRYSRDYRHTDPEKEGWTGKDWLAWLLHQLVTSNTDDLDGLFYRKNLSLEERERQMWQVIQRFLADTSNSRKTRSGKKAEGSSAAESSSPAPAPTSTTTAPARPDIKSQCGGEVDVFWQNIPKELRKTHPILVEVQGFAEKNWDAFIQELSDNFNLDHVKLRVDTVNIADTVLEDIPPADDDRSFNTVNEETFEYLVEYCLRQDRAVSLYITTAQQIESLVTDLGRSATLSNSEAYRTMVEEMHQGEKNEDDRFWKWARLRGAKGTTSISSQTLENVEIDSLEMGLQWLQFLASNHDDEDSESNTGNDTVSSEVKDLTEEQVDTHKKLETYLSNLEYERQGNRECCEALGIENPQIPCLKNMRLSVVLKPWQTVGIKALVDLEDGEMNGGVLADLVGLGKTWEVTGLLQYRLNQRIEKIEKGEDVPMAKPTLLVCPANLIGQWAEEIGRISGSFDVRIYHGGRLTIDQDAPHSKISKVLRKDDKLFDGSEENSKAIIITSYKTFLKRHGPNAYKNYLVKKLVNEGLSRKDAKARVDEEFTGSPDTEWDQNLDGCFERVVLDEGHEIRNSDTQTWKSIRWLHAKYHVIATATPLIDSVKDFSGILGMLQSRDDLWTENSLQNLGAFELVPKIDPSLPAQERERATFSRDEYLTRFDPWDYVDEHPVSILRLTKESYIEHVAKLRASNHERGRRAWEVFKSCMLRRTYNSCIDGTRISDDMPVVQHNIIECRLSDEEFPRYKEIFRECMSKLHRKRKDDVVLDTNVYRQLLLVGTWLNCEHILDYKVNKLREFRKANRSAYDILKDVQSKQKSRRFPPHLTLQLPEPNDKEGILKAFCTGSPKLRALAELIADLVLMRKEKVVVWCTLPAQQLIIEKFLREAGIDARAYHAGLNLDERIRLTKSFNTSGGVVVLIGGYFMSVTGSNWQFFCRDAIMFDEAPSKGVDDQALGRIRRVGQRSYVRVYRLYMLESFDEHLRSRLIVKALPGLMTELNMDIFGVGENGDEGDEVMLGDYVLEDGKLVSLDDLPCNERDYADVLPADELLMLIQKSLRGDELKLSAGDKMALAKSR